MVIPTRRFQPFTFTIKKYILQETRDLMQIHDFPPEVFSEILIRIVWLLFQ